MIVADLNFCEPVEFTHSIIGGISATPNSNANTNFDSYDFELPNSNTFATGDVTNTSNKSLNNDNEKMEMRISFAESK
ncbi:hypothetical protein CBP27_01325 [Fischerella thermalis WC542]|jgi:hypothetical protein|uniref:Uncharacterized protein n=2 Tax=Fischerella TaxID=1190 RepID=G6FXM0_9CYAN|nr:hypothetical protein [Fischerella thermalis]MBF2068769.1 hypothetical protein [Fischerella thermalis M48_A2018_028]PLZ94160.1 hypothetical protein CI593_01070 [Fischerella thermalis CCMEE 5194]PMB42316.1 hypothetical protein CEN40_18260 [Fischerella thermalis CCMEE 5205]EHC10082.1 hypothetical protein FJSC11DRAFT_3619 [Fischerella thermalis JSC-11]MBF1988095.1 hypothetical protein [Fischerella thermalis M58_A2018_009]